MVQIKNMKIINERVNKSKKNQDKLLDFIKITYELLYDQLLIRPNVDRNKILEIDASVCKISIIITLIRNDVQLLLNSYQFNETEIMNDETYNYTSEYTLRIHTKTEQLLSDGNMYFLKCIDIINNIKNNIQM
jgi:hypothetical protein